MVRTGSGVSKTKTFGVSQLMITDNSRLEIPERVYPCGFGTFYLKIKPSQR
jgi:hypothetical protein